MSSNSTSNLVLRAVRPLGGAPVDIYVRSGVVQKIEPSSRRDGRILLPALVDLHTHLREPGGEDSETIATGTAAAAAGGYSDVFAMANTVPVPDGVAEVQRARERNARDGIVRVHQVASITRGLAGTELSPIEELSQIGVRLFSDDGHCVNDAALMREALMTAARCGVVLAQHAQSTELAGDGQINAGVAAATTGSRAWPAVAEQVIVARDCVLAGEAGAQLHVCHASTAGTVEIIRWAKAQGVSVTAEVAPHHLLLTDELAASGDPRFKVNPPLRSTEDVWALREALVDGTIDAIATDHAPHPAARKRRPWNTAAFGMIGLETAVAVTAHALTETNSFTWSLLAELMARRPARIGGLREVSRDPVAVGEPASFALVDDNAQWEVDPDASVSKSSNTPFGGRRFTNRVTTTIVDGHVVYGNADLSR